MMKDFIRANAHYAADGLTLLRFLISVLILYHAYQPSSVGRITPLVIIGLGSDVFDGILARRFGGTCLGSLDYPADLAFVVSILTYLIRSGFVSLFWMVPWSLGLFALAALFKNDSPVAFWMGSVYGLFILDTYFHHKPSFRAMLLTIGLIILVNPGRAVEKVRNFLKDFWRGVRGEVEKN